MNWTPEQVAAAERRIAANMAAKNIEEKDWPPYRKEIAKSAVGVSCAPRGMNKWESLFRDELEMWRLAGVVSWYEFEPMRLRLATFTQDGKERMIWYKPDFAAMACEQGGFSSLGLSSEETSLVLYEVKGFWREAARVRIKLAASRYPFRFVAVTREKGEWRYEEFGQ